MGWVVGAVGGGFEMWLSKGGIGVAWECENRMMYVQLQKELQLRFLRPENN